MNRPSLPIYVRCLLAAFVLATGLALRAAAVSAQSGVTVDQLEIQLWPEYDRPAMLVIFTGTLNPGVSLPAQVSVRIPAVVGRPSAVAVRDAAGQLFDATYTTAAAGDWSLVTFEASQTAFRVEYYDSGLAIAGGQRRFAFNWQPDFVVSAASVRVQMPVNSSGFQSTPTLAPTGPGDFGLDYYQAALGPLAPGQAIALQLQYSKPDSALSASVLQQPAALETNVSQPTPPAYLQPWAIAGMVLGVLLISLGGMYFYWMRNTSDSRAAGRPRPRRRTLRPEAALEPAPAGGGFCTQCGEPRQPDDRFCRKCGASLN